MMTKVSWLIGGLAVVSLGFGTAAAQGPKQHAVLLQGRGGGYNALTNLNDLATADTKLGFNVGGSVGVQVYRYVVLRADFTYARDELRDRGEDTGIHLNKYFYTAAVQLQYPSRVGVTPYAFVGGGGITVDQEGTTGGSKTRGVGVGGVGLSYTIPKSNWAVFAEGTGHLYQVKDFSGALAGFDKTQFDVAWSGGISYAIGF